MNETPAEKLKRYLDYIFGPKTVAPCEVCGVDTPETTRGKSGETKFVHCPADRDSAGCRDVWQYRERLASMMTQEQYIEYHHEEISNGDILLSEVMSYTDFITDKDYYHDYKSYIASNEWRIRADAMKRDARYTCEGCGQTAIRSNLHIHHRHYKTLYKERRKDLQILCSTCHRAKHGR